MANNTERIDPTYSDLLKARFCKQYIPRLKEFLSNFDISETIVEDKYIRNSLGMHFLLDKYDDIKEKDEEKRKKRIRILKENCKWHVNNVTEEDLLLAIEEFFHITNIQNINTPNKKTNQALDDNNTISGKRNKLLENLFQLGIEVDEQSSIADTTMFAIANYFGVKLEIRDLGKLYEPFESIAFALVEKDPIEVGVYQFQNALRLFSCVRNGVVHPDYKYSGERLTHYHEFIIFTYIGYVYTCRRIWKSFNFQDIPSGRIKYNNDKKERSKDITNFVFPKETPKVFELPLETVELKIESEYTDITIECKYKDGKNILVTKEKSGDNLYFANVKKYKKFTISIYNNIHKKICEIEDVELDYNSWFSCYKIVPPNNCTPSSKDYECLSEGCQRMTSIVAEYIKNEVAGEATEAIKHEFAAIQPIIPLIKENSGKIDELNNSLEGVLSQLVSVCKMSGDIKGPIEQIHLQIGSLHQRFLGKLDEFSDSLYDLKKKSEILVEKVDRLYEYAKQNRKITKWGLYTLLGLILFGGVFCLGKVFLLQNPIITTVLVICLVLYVVLFFYFCKRFNPLKCFQGILTAIVGMVASVFIAFSIFQIVIYIRDSYIKTYDFSQNDTERNLEVVKLMESILETNSKDDESLRTQLTKYYLDYADDTQKALQVASPMLNDIEKYKTGILALAEALYSQGKDFWKVKDLLCQYNKTIGGNSPVVNRINGILMTWGQGQECNVDSGMKLLKKAADGGDAEAQYYYGYALSHEMTDWGNYVKNKVINFSKYNLAEAIVYLRKALPKPKAALELGKLYSDLNMKDSARVYLDYSLQRSTGTLYKEALYRLGLLHKFNDKSEQAMLQAAILGYEPAILYRAKKEKDYKTIIDIYKRINCYLGYRYLLPITFGYISLGQKSKALQTLQNERPFGQFNEDFVAGMEAMLGSQYLKKDSIAGMEFMKKSAAKGCLYAEMICLYREAEHYGNTNAICIRMQEIGEEIPYAYVLLSHLAWKENSYNSYEIANSEILAREAISRGHAAGKLFLAVPNKYKEFDFYERLDTTLLNYHMQSRQIALRMKCDILANIYYGYKTFKALSKFIPCTDDEKQFWDDVSKANDVDLSMVYYTDSKIVDVITDEVLLKEFGDEIIDNILDSPFN